MVNEVIQIIRGEPLKALIVEDERLYRIIASQTLSGFQKIMAMDQQAGYANFLEYAPEIVFLDIQLPDGSGKDLLYALKSFDSDVFVIMMTKSNYLFDVNQSVGWGADGYLVKPFDQMHIDAYIEKFNLKMKQNTPKQIEKRRIRFAKAWYQYKQKISEQACAAEMGIQNKLVQQEVFQSDELALRIRTWKILFVDSQIVNGRKVSKELSHRGCKVDVEVSGAAAFENLKSNQYDMIFVETRLEDWDGYHLVNEIRNLEKKLPRHTYIVGMVADNQEAQTKKWQLAGMDGVLVKPLSMQDIYSEIVMFVQRSLEKGEQEFVQ